MSFEKFENAPEVAVKFMSRSKRLFYTSIVMIITFTAGMCYSLQAPIYPQEASAKGVPPSQYGFVFGVFQLVVFITSPFYGIYAETIRPPFLFKAGAFITAWCTILFGFLDRSPPGEVFFGLSLAIRIVGAIGDSAIYCASYILAIRLNTQAIATAMAAVETSFGIGLIIGPTLGGCLYDVDGFSLPFFVIGGILMFFSFLSMIIFRNLNIENTTEEDSDNGPDIWKICRNPRVIIETFAVFAVSIGGGFIQALLEPHIRPLNLTESQIGLVFMVMGMAYALASIVFGRIADKIGHFNYFSVIGLVFTIVGLLFLGPAPFIQIDLNIGMVIGSIIILGIGMGGVLINGVTGLLNTLIESGSPKNLATQSFVTGLYNSSYALGCFLGPTIGGVLYDSIGFSSSSMVMMGLEILAALLIVMLIVGKCIRSRHRRQLNTC